MAKINDEYDIGAAFEVIENELIASMIRNFENHKQKELDEKKNWSMWQTEMLKSLEKYKHDNQKKYGKQFKDINKQIEVLIGLARSEGGMNQEKRILEEIKKGFPAKRISKGGTAEFFKVNDRKLNALIQATTSDMQKAEAAVLRMANDQYRKIIYNAQVYANTGAGTYEKAVDMATKDFLSAGLNCIQYTNGARHTIADYADMAIRTASKRAYLQGEGEMRQQWGMHLVIMNKRGSPCPKCLPFVGKILIDDVWSGGSSKDGKYPLMSSAIAAGLYHPRCKDSHTTYFPGITKIDSKYNKQEISDLEDRAQQEARQQYAERQEKRFGRLAEFSLDPENQKKYGAKQNEWHKQSESIKEQVYVQDDIKSEIADMNIRQNVLEKQLAKAKENERTLTQKVYFEMTGTPEEIKRLKQVNEEKKAIEKTLSSLKDQILSTQEIYKNGVEKRLIEDKVLEKVKFSRKMNPETVDELESTIRNLHEKHGIMPKGIIYSPAKVEDTTATYNWIDDTIYISSNFNDPEKYLEKVRKSEQSLIEYNKHYDIKNKAKQRLDEAERILADKSVKGYEREKARIQKVEAEIQLKETRMAVRENAMDCFVHEYGHFIHRHAETDYIQKKSVYGMKELGGSLRSDWVYDINKHYSAKAKIAASSISRYAAKNPYETFAEGFLAMEKGEKIPEQIAKVIAEAKSRAGVKNIAKTIDSDILITGARIIDPDSTEGIKFAKMYYDEIRSFSTDAKKIAKNLGKEEPDIKKIKAYLFEDKSLYDPDTKSYRRFDPDCAIAQSWQRLMNGKDIKKHDRTLIEHELLEMRIKKENPSIEHLEAHRLAASKFNYPKEAGEYYGNLKKHKENTK